MLIKCHLCFSLQLDIIQFHRFPDLVLQCRAGTGFILKMHNADFIFVVTEKHIPYISGRLHADPMIVLPADLVKPGRNQMFFKILFQFPTCHCVSPPQNRLMWFLKLHLM